MKTVPMTVLETPVFLRKVASLLTEDEREALIGFLALNPAQAISLPKRVGCGKCAGPRRGKGNGAACELSIISTAMHFLSFS
jgi:hypothetical protein